MIKTEITDNLCLVSVNTRTESKLAVNLITSFLEENGLSPVFVSGGECLGRENKIIIAIDGNEIFSVMRVIGSIRHKACIKNYSINCSNAMIKWSGSREKSIRALSRVSFDIKLLVLTDNEGVCFCDSVYGKKLCSMLNSK